MLNTSCLWSTRCSTPRACAALGVGAVVHVEHCMANTSCLWSTGCWKLDACGTARAGCSVMCVWGSAGPTFSTLSRSIDAVARPHVGICMHVMGGKRCAASRQRPLIGLHGQRSPYQPASVSSSSCTRETSGRRAPCVHTRQASCGCDPDEALPHHEAVLSTTKQFAVPG